MNKKLFLALALPAFLVGCSQDDLVSESVVATAPDARAIDNVTFTIAKNAGSDGVESRADWVNNKIKFEQSDKVSLYWLGDDGLSAQSNGTFSVTKADLGTESLIGNSNAVFRTEDGTKFTAEAVVYEGYNLLVYPANVKHTTANTITVSLPNPQKAADDFAENAIYIGDSILHIHQPAKNTVPGSGKEYGAYYDIYGHKATTEDPNTSGYAHGIKTGVKLLTSLLNMDIRIVNAPANDVKINKIVLTDVNGSTNGSYFYNDGSLVAGNKVTYNNSGSMANYTNPWFEGGEYVEGITLSFDGVTTNVNGSTKGTMLLLPTGYTTFNVTTTSNQPVLKVYTNYGVVTIGGNVAANDAQTNAIYKKDGIEKAAVNDNQALMDIVMNATQYVDKSLKMYDANDTDDYKQDYEINSGVSMTRVIKVDMAKAEMVGMEASTTDELNAILKAAVANPNNKFTEGNKLSVALIPNADGEFELTNYEGLDAFVAKFKNGALALTVGENPVYATPLSTVVMNTTTVTELKDVEGLADAVTLTIPATSKINAVKNGTNNSDKRHVITNKIINKSEITLPKYSEISIETNKEGVLKYNVGAIINTQTVTGDQIGKIYYEADTYNHMIDAAKQGVNYIEIKNVTNAFFNGIVDLTGESYKANNASRGGITVEFNNCGDLTSTIENGIKTTAIVLSNGSTYTNMALAEVNNVIVKSANAKLGMGSTNVTNKSNIEKITIAEGTTVIEQINATTIDVKSGATVTITKDCVAPTNLYVWGTASFAGSNNQTDEKVFVNDAWGRLETINAITGQCVVTGSLELKKDLAYSNMAVSATTKITITEGVKGLGYTDKIHVSKAGQETATTNLIYCHKDYDESTRYSWDGVKFGTIQW